MINVFPKYKTQMKNNNTKSNTIKQCFSSGKYPGDLIYIIEIFKVRTCMYLLTIFHTPSSSPTNSFETPAYSKWARSLPGNSFGGITIYEIYVLFVATGTKLTYYFIATNSPKNGIPGPMNYLQKEPATRNEIRYTKFFFFTQNHPT